MTPVPSLAPAAAPRPGEPIAVRMESLDAVRRRLWFAVPPPAVASAFALTTARYAAKTRVAGFRPGKAPAAMIERMHAAEIRRAVLDDLLKVWVFRAILSSGINPVGRPEVESVGELARDKALDVQVLCEVLPTLELAGYEGADLHVTQVAADAEDLELAEQKKARDRAEQVPVERDFQPGDALVASWQVVDVDSEAPRLRGEEQKLVVDAEQVPFELRDLIARAAVGVTLDEDRPAEGTLAACHVTLTVHEATRTEIPALDDDLAKDLGHADLAELRAAVAAEVAAEVRLRNQTIRRDAAVAHLLATNPVQVPASFVGELVEQQVQQSFGGLDERTLRSLGGLLTEMRRRIRESTQAALRRGLALQALADKLEITVDEAALDRKLAELMAAEPGRQERIKREFQGAEGREDLRRRLRSDAAMDELVRVATFHVDAVQTLRAAEKAAARTANPGGDDAAESGGLELAHDPDQDHDHGDHHHVHDEHCNHG